MDTQNFLQQSTIVKTEKIQDEILVRQQAHLIFFFAKKLNHDQHIWSLLEFYKSDLDKETMKIMIEKEV
jgi:hypothetical protein